LIEFKGETVTGLGIEGLREPMCEAPNPTLDLVFGGTTCSVPASSLPELLDHVRSLFQPPSDSIPPSVPFDAFDALIASLNCELSDITSEFATFVTSRVSTLEEKLASPSQPRPGSPDEGLDALRSDVQNLKRSIQGSEQLLTWRSRLDIPVKGAESLDGIISYLSKRHEGNVHDTGVVTLTATSVDRDQPRWHPKCAADLASLSAFCSKNALGQWICWDFREMRILPTHYTIHADYLKSWVIEGSLDGESWTELDRQIETLVLANRARASWGRSNDKFYGTRFPVSPSAEFRFIRLSHAGKSVTGLDCLSVVAVEFFGTLFESLSSRISAIERKLAMAAPQHRIAMTEDKSLDGIILYLTRKYGGNVHLLGVVTVTSNGPEAYGNAVHLVDSRAGWAFEFDRRPNEWAQWDFHERRVCLSHYTISACYLRSWVVEVSLDGKSWTEIDRQTNTEDFRSGGEASFAVSKCANCRFVRLTQTDGGYECSPDHGCILLWALEFFGTLSE
jgi:hypothetical protein